MERDRGHHQREEDDGPEDVHDDVHQRRLRSSLLPPSTCAELGGAARAQASAASTASSVRSAPTTSDEPTSARGCVPRLRDVLVAAPARSRRRWRGRRADPRGRRRRRPRSPRCRRPARCRRAGRPSRASSTAGNASESSGSKVHSWACDQSHAAAAPGTRSGQPSASAIGSRMSGRRALRERRAVDELDHRVHQRLRVHDDVDPVERHAEEQVRLEQLEALVDQGGRVRGDDPAHVPGRVGQRLGRRHVGHLAPACARGTVPRSRSGRAGRPRRPDRRAGTGRSRSARSRPRRAGRAPRPRGRAGRRRRGTPCWPARGPRPAASAASVGREARSSR